MEETRNFQMT